MPQMAPISWLILFFIFSLAFILFNIMNYFCFLKYKLNETLSKNENSKNKFLNMSWKW